MKLKNYLLATIKVNFFTQFVRNSSILNLIILLTVFLNSSQISFGQVSISNNRFNNSSTLFSTTGGNYYTGNSFAGDRPASSPFAVEGSHSYGTSSLSSAAFTAVLNTPININTVDYTGVFLTFRLAAFSVGNATDGMDATDIVNVEVSPDGGTTYYSTARVLGNNNAYWAYSTGTGNASTAYDGNNTPVNFSPTGGGNRTADGYSTVTITGLPSTANLKVRISLTNNSTNELWLIDDFVVKGTLKPPTVGDKNFITRLFDGTTGDNVGNIKVKGDVTLIGNTIIGKASPAPITPDIPANLAALTLEANTVYNGGGNNNDFSFEYIDIDSDASTFSSSSANLDIRNLDGTPSDCTTVAYAGLYWAGSYAFNRSNNPSANNSGSAPFEDWNKVKFKVPGGNYVDIAVDKNNANVDVAGQEDEVIIRDNLGTASNLTIGSPYVCYKNVTNLFTGNFNENGTYTLANMRAGLGENQNGISAGWTLVVVFENKSYPSRYITVFDGFKYIQAGSATIDFNINGFKTVPSPFPVRAKIGVAGLEGDQGTGDKLNFTSPSTNTVFTSLTNFLNPADNFFNSTISNPTTIAPNFCEINPLRNPNSTNTLGFDIDVLNIPNPGNTIIANDATSAKIQFPSTGGDTYSSFLLTFAVEIIEPTIVLTKVVRNAAGAVLAPNAPVALGETLTYDITYQNTGNDNAQNFTIKDVLPNFVTLLSTTQPGLPVPINIPTPNSAGTLIFTVPNTQALQFSPAPYNIKIVVKVTSDPNVFIAACSNLIKNTAVAKYDGVLNPSTFNDESFASSDICNKIATSTNFIANLANTVIVKDVQLCGNTVTLTAPPGYLGYTWTNVTTNQPVVPGNTQSITVNNDDDYNVFCNVGSPCLPINIRYNVTQFVASNIANPVIPDSDYVLPACPSDDRAALPVISLCGNQTRFINPSISGATSYLWEKLGGCINPFLDCHVPLSNTSPPFNTCTWTTVSTDPNFTATDAGEYRVTIDFGTNCLKTWWFKVFKSNLTLDATVRNISCTVTGQITTSGLPASGYQYSINNFTTFQTNPIFTNVPEGPYTVCARLAPIAPATTPLPGACTYCKAVYVLNTSSSFLVSTTVIQPKCNGDDDGIIKVRITGGSPQFKFKLQIATPNAPFIADFAESNLQTADFYNFGPLAPGVYYVTGSNQDGCTQTITISIIDPPILNVSASLVTPVTCTDGLIKITPVGGTGPYSYNVDGNPNPNPIKDEIIILVPVPNTGLPQTITYSVEVTDYNNCTASNTITITTHPEPVHTIASTNILCYGNNSGQIKFTLVSNLGNYVLSYGVNGLSGTFQSSSTFNSLPPGTYTPIIKYSYPTIGNKDCFKILPDIIITEPLQGLTASGSVAELACPRPGGAIKGLVRITNPQGGTPFQPGNYYLYYFNSVPPQPLPASAPGVLPTGAQLSNQALMNVGANQVIYIQDASGCSFPMTISLDPPPTPPTLGPTQTVYNCDASSTSTITVNSNGGNFAYTYYLLPSTTPNSNIPPNVFTGVPCGPQNIKVTFTPINIPTFSVLLSENFGVGIDAVSPGINPNYCFERQVPATQCQGGIEINDGDYSVTKKVVAPYGAWWPVLDHTSSVVGPQNINGRFLAINIGGTAGIGGIIYSKPITDIIQNQPIKVSIWATNFLKIGNTQTDANLTIQLVKNLGLPGETIIATANTGDIPKTQTWLNFQLSLNPGPESSLSFVVRSNIAVTSGNDVAIDDIEVYQLPIVCTTETIIPINIPCSNAFTASVTQTSSVSCFGGNDGTVTITAQNFDLVNGFQYSINNGPWRTSLTSPVTSNPAPAFDPISSGTVNVRVRYSASTTLPCLFNLTPIVGTPTALVASSTATQATCLVGASINNSASNGGTPGVSGYQYQLENVPPTLPLIVSGYAFPGSSIFTSVPAGTYIVKVKDSKGCIDPIDNSITINALPVLTATIATTSNLCYNPAVSPSATIVVTPAGGLPPYTITYSQPNGLPPFSTATSNTIPVGNGTYVIKVLDSNSCEYTIPAPVVIAPQLTLIASLVKDVTCNGATPAANNAIVTATASGGLPTLVFEISLNGGATYVLASTLSGAGATVVGNTLTYSTSTAGTVRIRVKDANVSPNTCSTESAIFTITTPIAVTGNATPTQATCGLANGTVTLAALTGAAGSFTYSFNNSGYTSTTLYPGVAVGNNYPFGIKDSKGCTFLGTVTVTEPTPILGNSAIDTNYTCLGTGCIKAENVSGGVPGLGYMYSIGGAFQSSPLFCNLTNGTYIITIKDSKDCLKVLDPITFAPLNPVTDLTFTNTAPNCTAETASVTLTPSSSLPPTTGNPAFTYVITAPPSLIANVPVGNVFNNLPANTPITFKVTDGKGCFYSETYTITPVTKIGVTGSANNVQCFGTNSGNLTFNVTNSTNYNYVITKTGGTPVALFPITVNNYTLPSISLAALGNGSYTIVVTDVVTNCTSTANVTIAQPVIALSLAETVVPKTCFNGGSVSAIATGGWGSNQFTLIPPSGPAFTPNTNGSFGPLNINGSYDICVTDVNGCKVCKTFTISNSAAPVLALGTSNYCIGSSADSAKIVVNATGGTGTYQYFLNGSLFANTNTPANEFPNLAAGIYTIIAKDAAGCDSNPVTVTINQQLTVSATQTKGLDCTVSPNATYNITVANGYPTYSYQVQFNVNPFSTPPTLIAGTSFPFTAFSGAGTYNIRITDSQGCTATTQIVIAPLVPVTATTTQVDIKCNVPGSTDGSFTVFPSGGVPGVGGYLVAFGSGPFSNDFTNSGLTATDPLGTIYTYTVKDSNSCTYTGTVTIFNLFAPITYTGPNVIQLTIPGGGCGNAPIDNGSICFPSITGGLAPYDVTISAPCPINGSTTINSSTGFPICFNNLSACDYEIIIVDANNCQINVPTIRIQLPPDDLIITPNILASTCATGGAIEIALSGIFLSTNTTFYYALYTDNPLTPALDYETYQTNPGIYTGGLGVFSHIFTNLTPNTQYKFVVYSADNQCYFIITATTAQVAASATTLSVTNLTPNNVGCNGSGNGFINYTFATYGLNTVVQSQVVYFGTDDVVPGTTTISSGLSGSPVTINNVGPLLQGTYTIKFTIISGPDAGCKNASPPFQIFQSPPLTLIANETKKDACLKNIGIASGQGNGGSGGYKYQIFTAANAANPAIVPPFATFPVNAAYLAYQLFVNSAAWTTTSSFPGLATGNYVIFVKDTNGCVVSQPVTIGQVPALALDPLTVPNQCANVPAYTITATNNGGGFGIKTYTSTTATPSPNTTGVFIFSAPSVATVVSVTVTDENGCNDTKNITVYPKLNLSITPLTQPTCVPGTDGSITVSSVGGSGTYNYSISPAATLNVNVFSAMSPNVEYTITVTDAVTNCTDIKKITLQAPTPVAIQAINTTPVSCFNGNDGTITVVLAPSNNNGPYTYTLNPGNNIQNGNNVFPSLSAGTNYSITVTSARGCSDQVTGIIVGFPTQVTLSGIPVAFTCNSNNTVNTTTVTLTAGAGTPGSGYSFSNNGSNFIPTTTNTYTFNVTDTGVPQTIRYYVRDSKNCQTFTDVTVQPLAKITDLNIVQTTAINCTNGGETITVTPVGGSTPANFTYTLLGTGLNTPPSNNVFLLPSATNYTIRVTDVATGCYFDKGYTVLPFANQTVTATAGAAIACFGGTSTLSINLANYTGTYNYEVFQQGTPITSVYTNTGDTAISNPLAILSTFGAGVYFIKVTQTANPLCVLTSNTVTINAPATNVAVIVKSNINANCNSATSTVVVEGSGGTPSATGYSYIIVQQGSPAPLPGAFPATSTATFAAQLSLVTNANWTAYIKDANDCINQVNFSIATDPNPTIVLVAPFGNQCDLTALTYPINVSGTGLATVLMPLTYTINVNGTSSLASVNNSVPYPAIGSTTIVTVTVKDLNGCTATTPPVTIYPKLDINASITKQPICTDPVSLYNNGEVTFSSTGGNSGLVNTYAISPSAGTTFVAPDKFTGLTANVEYTITVTNGVGGCTDTVKVTPITPTPTTLLPFTKVDLKCKGDNNGSFVINLATPTTTVNNDPLYTYTLISQPVGATPIQVQNTFTGLIAGTYIVEVSSNSQCKVRETVTIDAPNVINVPLPLVTQAACPANSNVNSFPEIVSPLTGANAVSGGTIPYLYQFSQGTLANIVQPFSSDNSHTVTDPILVNTQYFLTVKDANGCTISSGPVTVNPFIKLDSFTVTTNQFITCATGSLQNITVTLVTNPVAPLPVPTYLYTVTGVTNTAFVVSNNTGIFNGLNGLPVGTYAITIKNLTTNCVLVGPYYYVNQPNTFQTNATDVVNATCFGASNGSVKITVVDNIVVPTDDAGPFTITLTNNTNLLFVYAGPTSSPNAGPFMLNNLPAGNYTVTTTLVASSCTSSTSFTISQPEDLIITAVKSANATCRNTGNVGEAAIDVTVSGGVTPYLVNVTRTLPSAFNYGDFAPGNITGLIAGTYSITVTDGTTPTPCTKPAITVVIPDQPVISGGVISSGLVGNKLLCNNDRNLQLTVTGLVGGNPASYTYTLNNLTLNTSSGPQSSNIFNALVNGTTGLGAGTYTVSVQDGFGCGVLTVGPITITEPAPLNATLSNPTPINCLGVVDIVLSASGGTPPYTYSTSAAGPYGGSFTVSTPPIVVSTGTYQYFVKDANNCAVATSNPIVIPAAPTLTLKPLESERVNCNGLNTGTITAVAVGGYNTNYTYNLSTSATGVPIVSTNNNGEFINLTAGDYWVNVTTTGGCDSGFQPIKVDPQLVFNVTVVEKNVTCNGLKDGKIDITVTNPIGEVEYFLSPDPGVYKPLTKIGATINYDPIVGLAPQTYTIVISDKVNCPFTKTFTIGEPSLLENNPTSDLIQAPCLGNSLDNTGGFTINMKPGTGTTVTSTANGGIIGDGYDLVSVDGKTLPTTYFTLNQTNLNTFVISGLSGGRHTVIMKDLNGCPLTITVDLDPSVELLPTAKVAYLCPNPQNKINTVTASVNPLVSAAGSGYTLSYSLDGGTYQSSPIFENVSPGLHYIDVKSEITYNTPLPIRTNTCIKRIDNIKVLFIDPLALTLTAGNQNEIIAIATGGTTPYNYNFNGVNTGSTASYIFDKTDKYFVTVTDNSGCTLTVSKTFNFIDIFIPNFFSPDGDGNNDGWAPQNTYNFKNLVFYVFDRYGRKIGAFNEGEFWDGKYQGSELPSGDYWYLVKPEGANDTKEYVGNFSLYR